MARFIPIDKMKKLREASKTGDSRAQKILDMQLTGTEDFGSLMDEYFAPVEVQKATEPKKDSPYQIYLKENSLEDSEDTRKEFYEATGTNPEEENSEANSLKEEPNEENGCKELIKKLLKEESDAIDSYSKAITQVMNCEEADDVKKRRIISRLKEIRGDEEEHFKELSDLLLTFEQNEPNQDSMNNN